MPRRQRAAADVQHKFEDRIGPPRRRRRRRDRRNGLDYTEVLSTVLNEFCKGHTAGEIVGEVRRRHKIKLSREEPYQFVSYAAQRKWVRFVPPHEHVLREAIRKDCYWLEGVEVVHTAVADDVAAHGAEVLYALIRKQHLAAPGKGEVHVGLSGGHTMRKLARELGELLREPAADMPATLVFHALVAGFDIRDPTTDPNAFFTHLASDTRMQVKTEFVGLHAPPIVRARQFKSLRNLPGLKDAYKESRKLDILVTSAGIWNDSHSQFRKYIEKSRPSKEALEAASCIGDIFWRPIAIGGPIETETEIRAMTLLELSDLPRLIQRGKHVLLLLGPCAGCNKPKSDILRAIRTMPSHLVTHLVVDSLTAGVVRTPQWNA